MLVAEKLRKAFSSILAVVDVSLRVRPGEVLGLLGPNGAGKTTTVRLILNIIQPDSGKVEFLGKRFTSEIQNQVGYLPEERGIYRKNKLLNTVIYFATLKGMTASASRQAALRWLDRFDLTKYADRKIEELSKGNQQKVQFIIAILHDPLFIILDEPFSGLDPVNQILLKDILLELKRQGKVIIFSTHVMEHAEKLCDTICLINRGRVVLEGELGEIKRRFGRNSIHLEFEGDAGFLPTLPQVKKAIVYGNSAEIRLEEGASSAAFLHAIGSRLDIRKFERQEPSLHSIFLHAVGETDIGLPAPVIETTVGTTL